MGGRRGDEAVVPDQRNLERTVGVKDMGFGMARISEGGQDFPRGVSRCHEHHLASVVKSVVLLAEMGFGCLNQWLNGDSPRSIVKSTGCTCIVVGRGGGWSIGGM